MRSIFCWMILILVGCFVSVNIIAVEPTIRIKSVRLADKANGGIRIVFDATDKINHQLFVLSSPNRLVLDLKNSSLVAEKTLSKIKSDLINNIRFAYRENDHLRIVFDLNQAIKVNSFILSANAKNLDRLVLDIKPEFINKAILTAEERQIKKRPLVIAIDAGHGGQDPGAVGINRAHEKKVVLAIAVELKKLFSQHPAYRPMMIRKGDYFVALADRRELAREGNADMFISIHADSFTNKKARGASVYTLSSKGATSATAKFLAEKENQSDLVGGVSLEDKDPLLSSVLVDLSMTYKMESSFDAATEVLKALGKVTQLHGNFVEKAGFAVLKTPDIPSILVEAGFMSNSQEAKQLVNRQFQKRLAKAIFMGIHTYFKKNAPEGTYIAHQIRHNPAQQHIVVSGDSLSAIAALYNVSLKQLMKANSLNRSHLKVGQKLTIP